MKVLDLACPSGHVFEGWFGSESDYQSQRQRQLVECPFCGSHELSKRLSAPRLNLKSASAAYQSQMTADGEPAAALTVPAEIPAKHNHSDHLPESIHSQPGISADTSHSDHVTIPSDQVRLQAAWLAVARKIMRETHDVGDQFVSQSRRMHYGEMEPRAIRGQASADEAQELREEGIDIVSLPLPDVAKETLQ
jgi:hypothetical protein